MYNPDQARYYQQQQILNATPAQQLVMMYDAAIKYALRAKTAIEKGDIQERYNNNRRVFEIVSYLNDILDMQKGGDVAARLRTIYMFLIKRSMQVDFKNDAAICDEIVGHLRTLRDSWQAIARAEKPMAAAESNANAGELRAAPKSAVA